jgi:hypothetical protein
MYAEACSFGNAGSCQRAELEADPDYAYCARFHPPSECDGEGWHQPESTATYTPSSSSSSSTSSAPVTPASTHLSEGECKSLFIEICHKAEPAIRNRINGERDIPDIDLAVNQWMGKCIDRFVREDMAKCTVVRCGDRWRRCIDNEIATPEELPKCERAQNDC